MRSPFGWNGRVIVTRGRGGNNPDCIAWTPCYHPRGPFLLASTRSMGTRKKWIMKTTLWLLLGLVVGVSATIYFRPVSQPVWAGNDRHEDYIMTTGPIVFGPNNTSDGIWLLDYRPCQLLGTIVAKNGSKTMGLHA